MNFIVKFRIKHEEKELNFMMKELSESSSKDSEIASTLISLKNSDTIYKNVRESCHVLN